MKVVGVDLGGTTTTIGLVDSEKESIVNKVQIDTNVHEGYVRVIERISRVINDIKDDSVAVGVGCPGSIYEGVVRFSPNLPDWKDVPLAKMIEERTGLKTFVENDANSFVLGEKWFGDGKGKKHIVALTLGTGVGGGVITHGILLKGHLGIGAELGHVTVMPRGPICGCGNYGCLEALASATAIVRMANEGKKKYPDSLIFKSEKITAKVVMDAARMGDELAVRIRDIMVESLGIAIAGFIHIFNPEIVIIGGGIARAGDLILNPLKKEVKRRVMPSFEGTYEIVISKLLDDSGVLGAASVALERLEV